MNVAFRTDASFAMGTGHVMRCLALAEALRTRSAKVRFICREHVGHLIDLIEDHDLPVLRLPRPVAGPPPASSADYGAWLGVTQSQDAEETAASLRGGEPDWIVVDSYALDVDWEKRVRPSARKLLVLEDLDGRTHDCDALLDQNYSDERARHLDRAPKSCQRLLGPRYALLRQEFRARPPFSLRTHRGRVERVAVFFGGSDPDNVSRTALEALSVPELRHLEVDLVVGVNNPRKADLDKLAEARPRTRVHGHVPDMAALMGEADLGIGAGGITTWERMCCGLPSVIVSIADNQTPASRALAQAGLVHYAGDGAEVGAARLSALLLKLVRDPLTLSEHCLRGQLLVDGLGAARVAEVLHPTPTEQIQLRAARDDDVVIYFNWANDPHVRRNAVHSEPISWPEHEAWFMEKMRTSTSRLFVLEASGLPVGQIRFDLVAGEMRIDYSLDEIARGRGWGTRLVDLGMARIRHAGPVRLSAAVKAENPRSHAVFRRLGFEATADHSGNLIVYRKQLCA